jgi:arylsulfatase A-like enzyme
MKLFVIVARGLQAGALGCYGNRWLRTPALDALAAGAVVFDRHFADRPDAAGARQTWRDGRYHFPIPAGSPLLPADAAADLIDVLRAGGVLTRLIVDASRPAPAAFAEGWDAVEHADGLEATLTAVGSALEDLAGRDHLLLWADLATALAPWDMPDEFREAVPSAKATAADDEEDSDGDDDEEEEALPPLEDVAEGPIDPTDDSFYLQLLEGYAGAVRYLDAAVGEMLAASEDVAVIFTSDRGLALGEHGIVGGGRPWLHNEVVHVPLLLRLPGSAEAGRRVAALTQAVDLAPTLAEMFGASLPGSHGRSMLPLVSGEVEEMRPQACSGLGAGGGIEWALRTAEWALLLPVQNAPGDEARGPQLYVKPDDRWEVNNVIQHHLELAESLERTLRDFVNTTTGRAK